MAPAPLAGSLSGHLSISDPEQRAPSSCASAAGKPSPRLAGLAARPTTCTLLSAPRPRFAGLVPVPLECARPGSGPAGEKNAPGGRGLNSRGPRAPRLLEIRGETEGLFLLIWIYGDLMLTLNSECFSPLQSYSNFGRGLPGPCGEPFLRAGGGMRAGGTLAPGTGSVGQHKGAGVTLRTDSHPRPPATPAHPPRPPIPLSPQGRRRSGCWAAAPQKDSEPQQRGAGSRCHTASSLGSPRPTPRLSDALNKSIFRSRGRVNTGQTQISGLHVHRE